LGFGVWVGGFKSARAGGAGGVVEFRRVLSDKGFRV
jgi:hypothetical protein